MQRRAREIYVESVLGLQHSDRNTNERYQRQRIRDILCYASVRLPYWKAALEAAHAGTVSAINSTEAIEGLKVMERTEVVKLFDQLVVPSVAAYQVTTSGTSGTHLRFRIGEASAFPRAWEIDHILRSITTDAQHSILRLSYTDLPWSTSQGFYFNPARATEPELRA